MSGDPPQYCLGLLYEGNYEQYPHYGSDHEHDGGHDDDYPEQHLQVQLAAQ